MRKLRKTNYESKHTIEGYASKCLACACWCAQCSCKGPNVLKVKSTSSKHGHGSKKVSKTKVK